MNSFTYPKVMPMKSLLPSSILAAGLLALGSLLLPTPAGETAGNKLESLDWQLPNENLRTPFEERIPIQFVNRTQNPQDWMALKKYWNEAIETVDNPLTGQKITRKVVKIKVPLGLSQNPPVPVENEMYLDRWILGKELYFDPILSSDSSVSCASCHQPTKGWTDQSPVSLGIGGKKGPVSAPPVFNSAYNQLQFWDGRAISLEDQAQGPVGNPLEMFNSDGHAWNQAVYRVREKPYYVEGFKKAYGTEPTRDGIAKAIALFERTVLNGNSLHDQADFAMRLRVFEEGGTKFELQAVDYETALKDAIANQDTHALKSVGLTTKDGAKVPALAQSLANGNKVFFGKARCNSCHVGDNFTDNQFHNLGVGVKDGKIPSNGIGRYAAQMIGHKNPDLVGAFKTPTIRGLVGTAPYMHDGSEKTLEEVVEFYNKGGNANRYLDPKMRDFDAEKAFLAAKKSGANYDGPEVHVFGPDQTPVAPLKLNLNDQEKKDLVLYMRALEGEPVDPIVADPDTMPPLLSSTKE
jgi:cytochrome c peroxidase